MNVADPVQLDGVVRVQGCIAPEPRDGAPVTVQPHHALLMRPGSTAVDPGVLAF